MDIVQINNRYFAKTKLMLVPADDNINSWFKIILDTKVNKLIKLKFNNYFNKFINDFVNKFINDFVNDLERFKSLNLCIVSGEEIKEGDYITDGKNIYQAPDIDSFIGLFKIMGTTDSLDIQLYDSQTGNKSYVSQVPQISERFVEKLIDRYNKGIEIDNVLTEVIPEGNGRNAGGSAVIIYDKWKPAINPNNTLNIKFPEKKKYGKDVEVLCRKAYEAGQNNILGQDEWVKRFL